MMLLQDNHLICYHAVMNFLVEKVIREGDAGRGRPANMALDA